MDVTWWAWAGLGTLVVVLLAIDLVGFALREGEIPLRHAVIASILWTVLGIAFGIAIWIGAGPRFGGQYMTGFFLEKSLSVDNLFVFALIFQYFGVPTEDQRKVMFWGIVGAIVMRGLFIVAGAALLAAFHWMIFVFGAFLILTGLRLAFGSDPDPDPSKNRLFIWLSRHLPLTPEREGRALVIEREGSRQATPLFGALVMIAVFDAIFALDSIPAIFGVTREVFIVASANAFSLLGLAALYFTLVRMMERFRHLTTGVAIVLVIVGIKMVLGEIVHTPEAAWLLLIVGVLGASVATSLRGERVATG